MTVYDCEGDDSLRCTRRLAAQTRKTRGSHVVLHSPPARPPVVMRGFSRQANGKHSAGHDKCAMPCPPQGHAIDPSSGPQQRPLACMPRGETRANGSRRPKPRPAATATLNVMVAHTLFMAMHEHRTAGGHGCASAGTPKVAPRAARRETDCFGGGSRKNCCTRDSCRCHMLQGFSKTVQCFVWLRCKQQSHNSKARLLPSPLLCGWAPRCLPLCAATVPLGRSGTCQRAAVFVSRLRMQAQKACHCCRAARALHNGACGSAATPPPCLCNTFRFPPAMPCWADCYDADARVCLGVPMPQTGRSSIASGWHGPPSTTRARAVSGMRVPCKRRESKGFACNAWGAAHVRLLTSAQACMNTD
jgi:hypothetical protein